VTAENAVMGVAIAVISFVGSMGNVLFAVALWGGGISFAGVIAFVYADLITIPVLNVYRKYYGWRVMLYILGVFFVTMAFTGFLMELLFDALGIVPNLAGGETATDRTYFERNYTFYLNLIAFALSGSSCTSTAVVSALPESTAIQSVECGPMIPDRPRRTTGRPTTSARRRARRRSRRIRQRTRPIGRWFTLTALTTTTITDRKPDSYDIDASSPASPGARFTERPSLEPVRDGPPVRPRCRATRVRRPIDRDCRGRSDRRRFRSRIRRCRETGDR